MNIQPMENHIVKRKNLNNLSFLTLRTFVLVLIWFENLKLNTFFPVVNFPLDAIHLTAWTEDGSSGWKLTETL